MEGGYNHGYMRDLEDFRDFEGVPLMSLLSDQPPVDNMEYQQNFISSSWPPPVSRVTYNQGSSYNFYHQNPSTHQFMSPISLPSSHTTPNYAPLNRFPSFPPDQNQFSFEAKPNLSPVEILGVEKPEDDGYNWRKYGQKQLKDGKYPKSYYRCTSSNCPVKKTIERSSEGHIMEITYQNRHNHAPMRQIESRQNEEETVVSQSDHERMSDSDEIGNSEVITDSADSEIDINDSKVENSGSSAFCSKRRDRKIIFETCSEVDLIDDGYRWRKYGQKSVKGNLHPRSYYKCTYDKCNVRKQIERSSRDPNIVLTTYEGKHTHEPVPSRAVNTHGMVSEQNNHLMNANR